MSDARESLLPKGVLVYRGPSRSGGQDDCVVVVGDHSYDVPTPWQWYADEWVDLMHAHEPALGAAVLATWAQHERVVAAAERALGKAYEAREVARILADDGSRARQVAYQEALIAVGRAKDVLRALGREP